MVTRNTKMQTWVGYRVRVTLQDKSMMVGTFMAFDQHLNVVLAECEEWRKVRKPRKGQKVTKMGDMKRTIGLVMIRGTEIVSFEVEAPPSGVGPSNMSAASALSFHANDTAIPGNATAGRTRGQPPPTGLM